MSKITIEEGKRKVVYECEKDELTIEQQIEIIKVLNTTIEIKELKTQDAEIKEEKPRFGLN